MSWMIEALKFILKSTKQSPVMTAISEVDAHLLSK